MTRFTGNPLLRNGPELFDALKTGPRVVLKFGPADYRIWYEAVGDGGYTTAAYATSTDGLTWSKQGPVLAPSAFWEGDEISPNSILIDGGTFELWYHGGGNTRPNRQIGRAVSTDQGLSWTKLPNPVLSIGASGSFDDYEVAEPRVFRLSTEYRMYYTGQDTSRVTSLGVATSPDGVVWTKAPGNPVLNAATWGNFWGGAFFHEGGLWHLWHGVTTGGTSALNYMWSLDGLAWNDGPNNPVLSQNSDPNAADYGLVGDSVSGYRDGASYRVMYTGFNWNLFGSQGRFEGICLASVAAGQCP